MNKNVALVIGASSGLGRGVLSTLAARGAYPVGAARTAEKLEDLVKEIGGESVPFNAADFGSYDTFFGRVQDIVTKQEASRLLVAYTPGFHELELLTDEQLVELDAPPDKKTATKMLGQKFKTMYRLNITAPLRIIDALKEFSVPISFLYVSSQAAEEKWHAKGNALYGPHKREMEESLAHINKPNWQVYSARYPFFRSDMGKRVFDKLALWDKELAKKSWEDVSVSVEDVARPTAELLLNGRSEQFSSPSPAVYDFRTLKRAA